MDSAGRLVVPKAVRDAAGFPPGTPLEVRFRDGCIEVTPAPVAVQLVRRGEVLVAERGTGLSGGPALTAAEVQDITESLRAGRASFETIDED